MNGCRLLNNNYLSPNQCVVSIGEATNVTNLFLLSETHQSYAVCNFNDQCQWFAFHSAIVLSEMSIVTANVAQQPQELYSIFDRKRKSFRCRSASLQIKVTKNPARLIHKFYKPPDAKMLLKLDARLHGVHSYLSVFLHFAIIIISGLIKIHRANLKCKTLRNGNVPSNFYLLVLWAADVFLAFVTFDSCYLIFISLSLSLSLYPSFFSFLSLSYLYMTSISTLHFASTFLLVHRPHFVMQHRQNNTKQFIKRRKSVLLLPATYLSDLTFRRIITSVGAKKYAKTNALKWNRLTREKKNEKERCFFQ